MGTASTEPLDSLRASYNSLNVQHSMWESWPGRNDLQNFRRDGDYLTQAESLEKYAATTGYVAAGDTQNYLSRFSEDEQFGVTAVSVAGRLVTRDLLDSVLEINFLRRHLGLAATDEINVLDVGAGYGRFAHRFTAAFPKSYVFCADAVPESTFLCDGYIRHRGFASQARAVRLDELDSIGQIDLAVNIHAWSECTLDSIRFWMDRIAELGAKYLYVVPHTPDMLSLERDGSGVCFLPAIEERGYRLIGREPKYNPSMGSAGIFPATYFLFRKKMRIEEIPGWFEQECRDTLEALIVQADIRTVIEVGSALGSSAAWFALRVDHVTCIDLWGAIPLAGIPENSHEVFLKNMEEIGVGERVTAIQGDSHDPNIYERVQDADLVWIDGDHTYEGCKRDIQVFGPKARKILCGDDYGTDNPDLDGVTRAVDELLPGRNRNGRFWWVNKC